MRLISIVVCSVVLAGLVLSQQTAYAQEKEAGKQQAKKAANEQAKKTEGVGEGKYSVWVFKMEEGKWVKQPERTLNTDNAKEANDYVDQVKAVEGWTANTNAPPPPVESVVGTWVGTVMVNGQPTQQEETYYLNGTCITTSPWGTANSTWRQSGSKVIEEHISSDGGRSTVVSHLRGGVLTEDPRSTTTGATVSSAVWTRKR